MTDGEGQHSHVRATTSQGLHVTHDSEKDLWEKIEGLQLTVSAIRNENVE